MARMIAESGARVILLEGSATEKIERALAEANARPQIVGRASTLQEAVLVGQAQARQGDVILLSPGAASFGMFANEFERGERFREIVNAL
jgi:UDP-N-acetylmuramoylalanine--D-glutamate ligase